MNGRNFRDRVQQKQCAKRPWDRKVGAKNAEASESHVVFLHKFTNFHARPFSSTWVIIHFCLYFDNFAVNIFYYFILLLFWFFNGRHARHCSVVLLPHKCWYGPTDLLASEIVHTDISICWTWSIHTSCSSLLRIVMLEKPIDMFSLALSKHEKRSQVIDFP